MFWIISFLVVAAVLFFLARKKNSPDFDGLFLALGILILLGLSLVIYLRADIVVRTDSLEDFPAGEYQVACRTAGKTLQGSSVVLFRSYGIITRAVMVPAENFKGSESLPVCQKISITVMTEVFTEQDGRNVKKTTLVPTPTENQKSSNENK